MSAPKNSDLPMVLNAWGLRLVDGKVLADRARAQQVMIGDRTRPELVPFVLYAGLTEDDISNETVATSLLKRLNLVSSGILEQVDGAGTTITPLFESSTESMRLDTSSVQMFPQPKDLLNDFVSQDKKELLAALVTGKAKTAFPDGAPGGDENAGDSDAEPPAGHLAEAVDSINVAVIADADILTDRTWVRVQQFLGMQIPDVIADNGEFVVNMADFFSGSNDLIAIRSKGGYQRPFTVVNEMVADARKQSAEKMKNLQQELEDTQKRLNELQRNAPEGAGSTLIANADLKNEIEQFQVKELETRRELRRLERSLRQDVENLGTRLKFINIALIPLFIGILAAGIGAWRVNHRRRR
jgi:ABC-type uncharacterized transport system involved in gliding motility auxiliary subunit